MKRSSTSRAADRGSLAAPSESPLRWWPRCHITTVSPWTSSDLSKQRLECGSPQARDLLRTSQGSTLNCTRLTPRDLSRTTDRAVCWSTLAGSQPPVASLRTMDASCALYSPPVSGRSGACPPMSGRCGESPCCHTSVPQATPCTWVPTLLRRTVRCFWFRIL